MYQKMDVKVQKYVKKELGLDPGAEALVSDFIETWLQETEVHDIVQVVKTIEDQSGWSDMQRKYGVAVAGFLVGYDFGKAAGRVEGFEQHKRMVEGFERHKRKEAMIANKKKRKSNTIILNKKEEK